MFVVFVLYCTCIIENLSFSIESAQCVDSKLLSVYLLKTSFWAILKICPNSKDSYFGKATHNIFA